MTTDDCARLLANGGPGALFGAMVAGAGALRGGLPGPRAGHAAAGPVNGLVFVFGGTRSSEEVVEPALWLHDLLTGGFLGVETIQPHCAVCKTPRCVLVDSVDLDGDQHVCRGVPNAGLADLPGGLRPLEPDAPHLLLSAPLARCGATAAVLPDACDAVVVFGGFVQPTRAAGAMHRGGHTNTLHVLETRTLLWVAADAAGAGGLTLLGKRPFPRDKHACVVHAGRLIVFGGWGTWAYDRGWGPRPAGTSTPLYGGAELWTPEGRGVTGWINTCDVLCTRRLRTHHELRWLEPPSDMGDRPSPRAAHTLTAMGDGTALMFGGRSRAGRLNDLYELDLEQLRWVQLCAAGPTPPARSWHTAVALDRHRLCIIGGLSDGELPVVLGCTWLFDRRSNSWSRLAPSPHCHEPAQLGGSDLGTTELVPELPFERRLWHTSIHDRDDGVIHSFGGCVDPLNAGLPPGAERYTASITSRHVAPPSLRALAARALSEGDGTRRWLRVREFEAAAQRIKPRG